VKVWSFLFADGTFHGKVYRAKNDDFLKENTPAGCRPIEGVYDPLYQRVDIDSGGVVSFVSPRVAELEMERLDREARFELQSRDSAAMRSVIEVLLNPDDLAARQRLQDVYDANLQTRRKLKP
jgi:hypothetical protein